MTTLEKELLSRLEYNSTYCKLRPYLTDSERSSLVRESEIIEELLQLVKSH